MIDYITNFIYSLIRIATPIIFVALSSTISQQAGLLNMAAEAMMLTSALAGVIVSALVQNVWIGILGGVLASVLLALFLCWAAFVLKVDLYLMSISLNMALVGGTVFVVYLLTGTKNTTAGVLQSLALGNVDIPIIKDIPILGAIISGHNLFTYIALAMTFVVWYLLFQTKIGLRIRASGQNPQAVESVGINPRKIYTLSFVLAAAIGSLGGMYLSMGYQAFFIRNITANGDNCRWYAGGLAHHEPCLWSGLFHHELSQALYCRRLFPVCASVFADHRVLFPDERVSHAKGSGAAENGAAACRRAEPCTGRGGAERRTARWQLNIWPAEM